MTQLELADALHALATKLDRPVVIAYAFIDDENGTPSGITVVFEDGLTFDMGRLLATVGQVAKGNIEDLRRKLEAVSVDALNDGIQEVLDAGEITAPDNTLRLREGIMEYPPDEEAPGIPGEE